MQPGSAALVAVVEPSRLSNVERVLEQHGAHCTTKEVSPELAEQLDREAANAQGKDTP
jgi:hypothetical protein